mmetsp:Transcript_22572/g.31517  ORF Transcript_22572/g.31517 Transcript_22572/m.31517 type:complete len:344 (+) Transcript_22572:291-1322(+)
MYSRSLFTDSKKLSRKEWRHHRVHAMIGLCCLIHFIYRYTLFFFFARSEEDMGFQGKVSSFNDSSTFEWGRRSCQRLLVFLPHFLLQVSGFRFTIPTVRHPDGNRIWGEYRYHALIFWGRCFVLLCWGYYGKFKTTIHATANAEVIEKTWYDRCVPILAVFMTMICADSITVWFRRRHESSPTTIRGLKGPSALLYLMSAAQFHATVNCLLTYDRVSVQIAAMTVVQSSAFGMTLRRKRLLGHVEGLIMYSLVLFLGMCAIQRDLEYHGVLYAATTVGNLAALARMDLKMNKYIIWTFVSMALPIIEKSEHDEKNAFWWSSACTATALILFLSALCRQLSITA